MDQNDIEYDLKAEASYGAWQMPEGEHGAHPLFRPFRRTRVGPFGWAPGPLKPGVQADHRLIKQVDTILSFIGSLQELLTLLSFGGVPSFDTLLTLQGILLGPKAILLTGVES